MSLLLTLGARRRLLASAGVRVVGALVVALGLVVGVRVLGPHQFGVSVLTLAVGQLIAFPLTALERLVIRLVSQEDFAAASRLVRRAHHISMATAAVFVVVALGLLLAGRPGGSLFVVAAGVSAVSAGLVVIRQGECRAAGRLGWGQIPNELFRPLATLLSYPLAVTIGGDQASGAIATLLASGATLAVILGAPRPSRDAAVLRGAENGPGTDAAPPTRLGAAAMHLMVVSAVALAVERIYPLVLGWTASASAVAVFAVVLRVVQLSNFSQAFGIFFYSPAIASALNVGEDVSWLTLRLRLIGMSSALPAALVCLAAPRLVEVVVGGGLRFETELRVASIAIMATALGGPAQTLLIMAGQERSVARAYLAAAAMSALGFGIMGGGTPLAATVGLSVAFLGWNGAQIVTARRHFGRWY